MRKASFSPSIVPDIQVNSWPKRFLSLNMTGTPKVDSTQRWRKSANKGGFLQVPKLSNSVDLENKKCIRIILLRHYHFAGQSNLTPYLMTNSLYSARYFLKFERCSAGQKLPTAKESQYSSMHSQKPELILTCTNYHILYVCMHRSILISSTIYR